MNKLVFLVTVAIFAVALGRRHPRGVSKQVYDHPRIINGKEVSANLYIDNAYHDAGTWGSIALCANDAFAVSIEIAYKEPAFDHLDETAVNKIRLYCESTEGLFTGYVESSFGNEGTVQPLVVCPLGPITGFQANVLEYQGAFTDDVALQDIQISCEGIMFPTIPDAIKPQPQGFNIGTWSSIAECPTGSGVCGLETRYEDASLGDATAICDLVLFCCPFPANATVTA